MAKDIETKSSQPTKRPFYLTGWGIALFSYLSAGVALPFLLWARGPKTKERRKRILTWTAIICVVVLPLPIIGAFIPANSDNTDTSAVEGSSEGQTKDTSAVEGSSEGQTKDTSAVEGSPEVQTKDTSAVEGSPEVQTKSMPMILGKNVSEISETLSDLENEMNLNIQYLDLVGDRSIWNQSNWIVAVQAPASGEVLKKDQLVCVGVRKVDETERDHQYRLPSDCPSALGPNTWPPSGFDLVLDGAFAINTEYRPDDPALQPCKLEKNNQVFISNTGSGEGQQSVGAPGRCIYYEFLSRERCANIRVRFQWLTSVDTVIGLGTTWAEGPIAAREKFRVMSFLPDKAWSYALGSHRIYEIICN